MQQHLDHGKHDGAGGYVSSAAGLQSRSGKTLLSEGTDLLTLNDLRSLNTENAKDFVRVQEI